MPRVASVSSVVNLKKNTNLNRKLIPQVRKKQYVLSWNSIMKVTHYSSTSHIIENVKHETCLFVCFK